MKRLLISASVAASAILPSVAHAQAIPGAVIAVVDLERVQSECTACKGAATALQSQASAIKAREQALTTPLQTEGQSIQTAINALNGKDPDAALQARIKAFDTKRQQGAQEIATRTQQFQRNQAYVAQQIQSKLNPIYSQVMQRRGANVLVEQGATLASASALDVTTDVLTALNTALPSVQTTAPAQQAPQGR
jgi:Skp family chaperone for outer membrane proteins